MVELYLRVLDYVLTPVLLVLSVILLLRGHDLPGGGFIAGLLATSAFALQILAHGAEQVRNTTGRWLTPVMGVGLIVAVGSALLGIVFGSTFFEGIWVTLHFGENIKYKIGTPVTFDFGVFLGVLGVSVNFLLGLGQGIILAPPLPPAPPAGNDAAQPTSAAGAAMQGDQP
jgi:multicomponent Na+:H+ antiporter subunit B